MKMLITIAWRNIWRHPGRSGVLLAAIFVGVWAGVTAAGISNGFVDQRFNRLVDEVSHLQIHHPEYTTERETSMTISNADSIIQTLNRDDRVLEYSARVQIEGMIQSPITTSGVEIRGIDPEKEHSTTGIKNDLDEGEFLDVTTRNPLVVGRKLAEDLNVEIGTRVVLLFQDLNNELISAAFNIVGMYSSASPMEERLIYARNEDLHPYLAEEPVYHEIAVLMKDEQQIEEMVSMLNEDFPQSEALTWYDLSPELRLYADLGNQATYYLMIVILLALAFGILNTMLMAIFERIKELGMLMAVGMNKTKVFTMICVESFFITMTGATIGLLFSIASIRYFNLNGMDLSAFGEGLEEFGYDAVIYPNLSPEEFVGVTLLVAVTAILASIYPAIKAIRLQPATAVRD